MSALAVRRPSQAVVGGFGGNIPPEVQRRAAQKLDKALDVVIDLCENGARESVRLDAAKALFIIAAGMDPADVDADDSPRARPVLVSDAIAIVREHRAAELAAKRGNGHGDGSNGSNGHG